MYKKKITIAIVTKKRPEKLARLLRSIVEQKLKPIQVIVVDNDLQLSAQKVVSKFSPYLSIKYVVEKRQGVPFARNKALSVVKTPYLGFIDDDCIVEENWVFVVEKIVSKFPKISYFVGNSMLFNPQNLVAVAQYVHQRYWFMQKLGVNNETSPFNVDTKNIVFKVADLKSHKLKFDISFTEGWFDSADTDMGFSMESKKMIGKFVEELKIWHEETTSLLYFLKKGYCRGKLAFMLAKKWNIKDEFVYLPFLSWRKYIKSIRGWSKEYERYFSVVEKRSFMSFLFIKIYERFFLWGYVEQAKKIDIKSR